MEYNCPKFYTDVTIHENSTFFGNRKIYLLGSKSSDKAIKIDCDDLAIINELLCLFNGFNNLDKVNQELINKGYIVNLTKLVELFARNYLLEDVEGISNSELDLTSKKIIDLPIRKTKKSNFIKTFCFFLVKCIPVLIVIFLIFLVINIDYYGEFYIDRNIVIYTFFTPILAMIIHEFGHIIYAIAFEIQISRIRISLLWGIIPIIYIKYFNLYFIRPQIRLGLILYGVITNLLVALLSSTLYYYYEYDILLSLTLVNCGCIIVNILPFQATDGYFALCTIFDKNNIRLSIIRSLFYSKNELNIKLKLLRLMYLTIIFSLAFNLCEFLYDLFMVATKNQFQSHSVLIYCIIIIIVSIQLLSVYLKIKKTFEKKKKEK